MMARREFPTLLPLRQAAIDWLLSRGITPAAIGNPTAIMQAKGARAPDGRFDPDDAGAQWLAFRESTDAIFWRPNTSELAWDTGRAFCLGEDLIDSPATTAFGRYLSIFASPLAWLQHERKGIVVLRWELAFDRLRDVQRIAVAEELLPADRKAMRPRLPTLAVLPKAARAAA
jgi:hypothetical protein